MDWERTSGFPDESVDKQISPPRSYRAEPLIAVRGRELIRGVCDAEAVVSIRRGKSRFEMCSLRK
jgi:hypothetical protein